MASWGPESFRSLESTVNHSTPGQKSTRRLVRASYGLWSHELTYVIRITCRHGMDSYLIKQEQTHHFGVQLVLVCSMISFSSRFSLDGLLGSGSASTFTCFSILACWAGSMKAVGSGVICTSPGVPDALYARCPYRNIHGGIYPGKV